MNSIMKKPVFLVLIMLISWSTFSQQISIPRVDLMPDDPVPYYLRNWQQVARDYDSLVFNINAEGTYLPLTGINESGVNYEGKSITMSTYVGQSPDGGAEAINVIPALVGATLSGIDKRDQYEENWVLMARDFFNRQNGENIYLNNYSGSSGSDWWYETMPNVFFYQLYDLYPETSGFNHQFESVANRWHEALEYMGGSTTPWEQPYMNYRAWNFSQMEPVESGVKQPEAAGAIAWLLYHAYLETENEKYRIGAEWAMEFLNNWETNPNYELQLAYGVYTAARMNVELGTLYDMEKLINWNFDRGPLRGWGIITGKWGDYDCYGLRGEANDQGNDYAFLMNGIQQAVALVPMVRYQEQYANAIAKWMLNLANASRLFYPGFLPEDQQDHPDWALDHDPHKTIAHEAMKEEKNGFSPYATGDAMQGGWAPTNLSLYSSAHAGYLGALISETNVEKILQLNLTKTDFFSESFPTYLLWNPYDTDTLVTVDVGDEPVDVYDSRTNQVIANGVSGEMNISVPAQDSRMLVYLPAEADIIYDGSKSIAEGKVFDYNNGEDNTQIPPRIKALDALQNPVEINDSLFLYCTASGADLEYEWEFDGETHEAGVELSIKAPEKAGNYEAKVRVAGSFGLADSASLAIEVHDKIAFIPEIKKIVADPRKTEPGDSVELTCVFEEENGDEVTVTWETNEGNIEGQGETVIWTAPSSEGDFYVYCTVADVDGEETDSLKLMVRNMESLESGQPVLYLPFNGHALDASPEEQATEEHNLDYGLDSLGEEKSAAIFNGNSAYVNVDNHETLNFNNNMTLAGWFYSRHDNSGEAYLISHGSWENRWKISLSNQTLRATLNTNEGIVDLDSESKIQNERWYHFSAVYTGEDLELYINGRLDAFASWQGELNQTGYDLVVGKARPDQDYFFKGRMDEVYVFDHAMAPKHIQELVTNGLNNLQKPIKNPDDIKVFPNPASKFLWIALPKQKPGKVDFQLMNLAGYPVQSGSWYSASKQMKKLSLMNFSPGVYLLSVKGKDFRIVKKISIIH